MPDWRVSLDLAKAGRVASLARELVLRALLALPTFGQVNEPAMCGILGSSSRGLRDPPPLYIECRIPLSAVKHTRSIISSSACKTALYSLNSLYSDIVAFASPKEFPTSYYS
jgi:hypothetical protein